MHLNNSSDDGAPGSQSSSVGSPYQLLAGLLRQVRVIVGLPVVAALLTALGVLIPARTFTAKASFVPSGEQSGQSQISSLAAQFGVSVGGAGGTAESAAFYKTLLTSDQIVADLVTRRITIREDGAPRTKSLVELLLEDDATEPDAVERASEALRERLRISIDRETGVVELKAKTRWREASFSVVRDMVQLANDFNTRKRQERASAEQAFIQSRLAEAATGLRRAEDELQSFLQRNRSYSGDPQLVFAYERLQRTVQLRQAVYTTLAQSVEQASLNANRNTPVVVTVQSPVVGVSPDPRNLALKVLLALMVGTFVGLVAAALREFFVSARERFPEAYTSYARMRRGLLAPVVGEPSTTEK
jgi:uncharacterized protein involved in exopolysaccharide biosynthesis